jgi:hypothetical protein
LALSLFLQPDELATAGYLLKIFRACVAKMPKTASSFARDLERKLLPMINSGAGGSIVRFFPYLWYEVDDVLTCLPG